MTGDGRPAEGLANTYEDPVRAAAYAALEFPATYHLAFRDLPRILATHVQGREALDFGCGAGRSTRFLRALGYRTLGVDIAEPMLARARARDPEGAYQLIPDGGLEAAVQGSFDLILAAFPFDNVPTRERKVALFGALGRRLRPGGRIVNVASAPELYLHEWTSFSTCDFPENRSARSGDVVRVVMLDVPDRRPVEDTLCTDDEYREVFRRAGLELVETHRPLGDPSEPFPWVSETTVAPWVIHVLGRAVDSQSRPG